MRSTMEPHTHLSGLFGRVAFHQHRYVGFYWLVPLKTSSSSRWSWKSFRPWTRNITDAVYKRARGQRPFHLPLLLHTTGHNIQRHLLSSSLSSSALLFIFASAALSNCCRSFLHIHVITPAKRTGFGYPTISVYHSSVWLSCDHPAHSNSTPVAVHAHWYS